MIGLFGFAVIFGLGRWRRWPPGLAAVLSGLWWLVVITVHLPQLAPNGAARLVGGDFRGWAVLGIIAAVVMAYRGVLSRLRGRLAPPEKPKESGTFRPAELDRYARHILLREIGGPGQKRLREARVLVVGAGGLGSPVILYLAAAGVGTIGVIDGDEVEASNLQRQVIHADQRLGMPKVFSAQIAANALNPFVEIRPYHRRLTDGIAAGLIAEHDLVLDGSDNFDTRYLVNRTCAKAGVPLIAAALTQWEGQVSLYDPARGSPCYECVFPVRPDPATVPSCAEAGVAAPLPGILGSIMAIEAVKYLTGAGTPLSGRLMLVDALHGENRTLITARNPACPACGAVKS